jgi:hypothetical protein
MLQKAVALEVTEFLGRDRYQRSADCWKSFFEDMKCRGLKEPVLVVIDSNSGCMGAASVTSPISGPEPPEIRLAFIRPRCEREGVSVSASR